MSETVLDFIPKQKYQVTYENTVTGGVSILTGHFVHMLIDDPEVALFQDTTGKARYVRKSAVVKAVER